MKRLVGSYDVVRGGKSYSLTIEVDPERIADKLMAYVNNPIWKTADTKGVKKGGRLHGGITYEIKAKQEEES